MVHNPACSEAEGCRICAKLRTIADSGELEIQSVSEAYGSRGRDNSFDRADPLFCAGILAQNNGVLQINDKACACVAS